jgi:hypothetical protein
MTNSTGLRAKDTQRIIAMKTTMATCTTKQTTKVSANRSNFLIKDYPM